MRGVSFEISGRAQRAHDADLAILLQPSAIQPDPVERANIECQVESQGLLLKTRIKEYILKLY